MFYFFVFSFSQDSESTGLFQKYYKDNIFVIDASGSSKQKINGTKQMTLPEYSVYPFDKKYDWCSNCIKSYSGHPWIIFSLKSGKIKFDSYFIRTGCCVDGCCCEDYGYCIDCCLYSWSLQISDDNITWNDVHRVEKDTEMKRCKEKTYKFDKEYTAKFIRLYQNEHCPGRPPCISLNKIEFYGSIVDSDFNKEIEFSNDELDDDDISIIGHISRNGNVQK